ncbi:MAG: hypothetical protein ACFE75_02935 [Candidatus Hodarchaeota archaeon]
MTKSYNLKDLTRRDNSENNTKRKRKVYIEESNEKEHLKIWDVNPSFKDIYRNLSIAKTISLLVLVFFVIISCYFFTKLLVTSIILGLLFIGLFIVIFHDEFYLLRYFIPFNFRNKVLFNPFEDFTFWYEKDEASTLFISNRKDLIHIALRIFQVDVVPENVHSALPQFVRALSAKNTLLSYSYQVIQKPIIPFFKDETSRETALKSLQSRITSIYFTVFCHVKGILTEHKMDRLKYYIRKDSNTLKSNLVSNFHHFRATLLSDTALLNALRTIITRNNTALDIKKQEIKGNNYHIVGKLSFCLLFILYINFVFLFFKVFVLYIFIINVAVVFSLVLIWGRSFLFQFTKMKFVRNIITINPFKSIDFYHIKKYPYSLFLHIDNKLLIGMKMVNLKYVYQTPFCLLGKFIESLNNHKVHFSYTLKNEPLTYYEFYHKGLDFLNGKHKKLILKKKSTKIEDGVSAEQWLGYRYGMWYSMLTISIYTYEYVNSIMIDTFERIEDKLNLQIDALKGAFNINFYGYELEDLKSTTLLSGYLFTSIKNNLFRLNGTHLNYVMLQGARMYPLTNVVDILKKGTETKIAAEFNTPLYLENFITIGNTINTEVWEREVPVGFTLEQLKNLLIVNGTSQNRDKLRMKIVTELVRVKIPSLIFDFDGTWSKLIQYFRNTRFEHELLYFKYGSAFTIDPLTSDIPYDTKNANYLEYLYDAFGIAFKKDERTVEMFRNTIQSHPGMDLGSIRMALQNQSEWEKSPINNLLLYLFSDFSQDDLTHFQPVQKDTIISSNFIQTPQTVIIDLSLLRDLNKKMFLTFVLLAKMIHYTTSVEKYYKKIIFIPFIDAFFDSYYLNLKRNYDKVDLFLKPLVEKDFGIIFTANQINNLHANLLLYFTNIIALRASDMRDIVILRNVMNLQELQGIGYYTSSRNNTYQIDYLKNMRNNEVLIRRDDIYQPFPARIDWEEIQKIKPLQHEEVVSFMKAQGYDLLSTQQKILDQARETLFEIDLGHYFIYVQEIINFLDYIQTVDQIGNLYKQKLKQDLKEYLYPKISQKTQKKEHMKKIRDNVLETLIRHGYLLENHPRRASGSEALRTSYSVGDRYHQALEDYYKVKGKIYTDINVEILEQGSKQQSDLRHIFHDRPRKYIVQQHNLKDALMREFSDFNYDIFKIYSYIDAEDYSNALKIEHMLIKKYLMNVYRQFHNLTSVSIEDLNQFLSDLEDTKDFPFTKQELIDYVNKYENLNLKKGNLESLAKDIYTFLYEFFIKIQHYIYGV